VPVDRELVDTTALGLFIDENLSHLGGPFQVQRLGEGQSCLTFAL